MTGARLRLMLVGLLLVGAGMLGASLWLAQRWLTTPMVHAAVVVSIPQGATVQRIAQQLQQQIGLAHPRLWSWWVRYQQLGSRVKAGEYQLQPGMTPQQVLELLSSGNVLLRSVTVVEGTRFAEFRRQLASRDDVTQTVAHLPDSELLRSLGIPGTHPEGWFFPDTYRFAKGTRDIEILRLAYQRMQKELQLAWQQRDPQLPLSSAYEALIMASIVEKESALPAERARIAGVFITRLHRGMRLQTDPTVIYGLGDQYTGDLRSADMRRDTPYNTYTRAGLPPTPICLPGAGALRAVIKPQVTGEVYFVATGRGDGSHYFSRTLAEHTAAWRRYLKATQP